VAHTVGGRDTADGAPAGERRSFPRVHYARGILPPGVRVQPAREVIAVNLSRGGVLVESVWRFRPGASVTLHVQQGTGGFQVRGTVERCFVHALERGGGVRYRAAIRFEAPLVSDPPSDALYGAG
jgi:hypothetical protein